MAFKLSKDAIDEIASLRGLQKKAKINREISRYRDELESAARKLVVSDKEVDRLVEEEVISFDKEKDKEIKKVKDSKNLSEKQIEDKVKEIEASKVKERERLRLEILPVETLRMKKLQQEAFDDIAAEIIAARAYIKASVKLAGKETSDLENYKRRVTNPLLDMNIYVDGNLIDGDDLYSTEIKGKLDIRNPLPENLKNEQLQEDLKSTIHPEAFKFNYDKIKQTLEDKSRTSEEVQLKNKFPVNKYLGAIDVSKKKNRIEIYNYWAEVGDLYDVFEDNLAEFFMAIKRSKLPENILDTFDKLYSKVAQENLEYIALFENVEDKFLNAHHRFFNIIAAMIATERLFDKDNYNFMEEGEHSESEYGDVTSQLAAEMISILGNSSTEGASILEGVETEEFVWEDDYKAILSAADPLLMYEINRGEKLVSISKKMESQLLKVLEELGDVLDESFCSIDGYNDEASCENAGGKWTFSPVSLDTTADIDKWFDEMEDTLVLDEGDVGVDESFNAKMPLPISVMTNSEFSKMYSTDKFKSISRNKDIDVGVMSTIKDFFSDLHILLSDEEFQFEVKGRSSKGSSRGSEVGDWRERRGTSMEGVSANPLSMNQKGKLRPELESVKQSLVKLLDSANDYYFDPLYSGLMPIQIPTFGSSIGAKVMQTMSLDLGLETVMTAAYDTLSAGSSKEINVGDLDTIADFLDNIFMPSVEIDDGLILDGELAASSLTRIFRKEEINHNYCAALIHHYMEDIGDLSREKDEFGEGSGKSILQRSVDFHEDYTSRKAIPMFAMPHWLDMNQGILTETPALKRAYTRLKDIFEHVQTDLPVLLHKLLKAHDVIRSELGMDVTYGYNPLNEYGVTRVINKMQTDENIDLSYLEIEQIVKGVDSHKNISREHGISAEHVYKIKALFR